MAPFSGGSPPVADSAIATCLSSHAVPPASAHTPATVVQIRAAPVRPSGVVIVLTVPP